MNVVERLVRVVFKGVDDVSGATGSAGKSLDKFSADLKRWALGFIGFTAAWNAVKAVAGAVTDTIRESFVAFDNLERSQRKLEGTAKLTGIALEDLNVLAAVGREAFGLSTVTARDFATEIAKLGEKAGDTTKSKEALQAFLEIGAARGLTATETLKKLQQSLLGIDEGTDALFGKNPSGLWDDYASVIGKAAGKFNDTDKAAALLHAALDGGTKVLGSYAAFLDSTAGKADRLAQINEERLAQMGASLKGLRDAYIDVATDVKPGFFDLMRREIDNLNNTIEGWKAVTYGALATVSRWLGADDSFVKYGTKAVESARKADEWARTSAQSAKELADATKGYGGSIRDVIPDIDASRDAFVGAVNPLDAFTKGNEAAAIAVGKVGPRAKMSKEEVEAYAKTNWKSAEEIAKAKKAEEQAWSDYVSRLKAWYAMLKDEVVKYEEVLKRMKPALDKSFDQASIKGHNQALRDVQASADAAVEAMKKHGDLPPLVKKVHREVKGLSDELVIGARTALDVGDAFGWIDDKAKAAATSTLNTADAISKMMTGGVTFAGVTAVIGGVASIVSNMMQGDRERKELTRQNTEALNGIRREGVRLSTSASGAQISGLAGALTPDLVNSLKNLTTEAGRGAGNQILVQALAAAGLRLSDLDAVASDLGMNLRRSNGQIDLAQLPFLLEALQGGGRDLTNIGTGFGEQLDFFREGQSLRGVTGAAGAQGLLDFLKQSGVQAFNGINLNDPGAARQQLLALFDQLGSENGIAAGLLGPATGEQLRDLIAELIRSLGDGTTDGAGGGAGSGISTGDFSSGSVTAPVATGGAPGVDTSSWMADLSALTEHMEPVAPILTESLAVLRESLARHGETVDLLRVIADRGAGADIDAIDAALEARRRAALLDRGQFPVVR